MTAVISHQISPASYFPSSGSVSVNPEGTLIRNGKLGVDRPAFLVIDLFCGAGGVTTGMSRARNVGLVFNKVVAAVNHDPNAIASHKANHVKVMHFNEGVQDVDMTVLQRRVREYREKYPFSFVILWGSPDCTGHSIANGGNTKKKDSRTQPNFLIRYVKVLQPDYVMVENVKEIRWWGPRTKSKKVLDRKTGKRKEIGDKLIPETKGKYYRQWVHRMCQIGKHGQGYRYEHRILNSADYGEATSRKRYFALFAKGDLPMIFPKQTHAKGTKQSLRGTGLKPWIPARSVLDLHDTGESIFNREEGYYVEATLQRLLSGLKKYVIPQLEARPILELDTEHPEVMQWFQQTGTGTSKTWEIDRPFRVVTGAWNEMLVSTQRLAPWLHVYHGSARKDYARPGVSGEEPAPTVTVAQRLSKVQAVPMDHSYLVKYYGTGAAVPLDTAAPTVTTKDRFGLASAIPAFLDKQYGSGPCNHQNLNQPAGTVVGTPKFNLVSPQGFLLNPQFQSKGGSLNDPAFTIIARMDKAPPHLVQIEQGGPYGIVIYEDDPKAVKEIKLLMAQYGLKDIHMRMVSIPELKRIQGFGDDYILQGGEGAQKKQLGNAVTPKIPQRWAEALYEALLDHIDQQLSQRIAA